MLAEIALAEMIYSLFVYLHLSLLLTKYYFCMHFESSKIQLNAVSIDK